MLKIFLKHNKLCIVALSLSFGGCQRASYSFQPVSAGVSAEMARPVEAPVALDVPAAFFATGSLREGPHSAGQPHTLRATANCRRITAATARRRPTPRANAQPLRVAQRKAEAGLLPTDIVRIITSNLKPKNGEYYRRFFQVNPDADTLPDATTE